MIILFRWILGGLAGLFFLWLTVLNWSVFWRRHVRREEAPSWTPLLGGVIGAAALLFIPVGLSGYWWLPFIIDWGSAPGIIYSIIWHLVQQSRQ